MAEDKHSKKHPASDHKKRQLKKKGTVAKSQDVPMAFGLLAAFGAIVAMKGYYLRQFEETMRYCIQQIEDPDRIHIAGLMLFVLVKIAMLSAPVLLAVLVVGIVANMGQTGLIFTGEQMKPNLKKINPMTKLKQWFSIKSLQELGKSLAKIIAAFVIGFFVWKGAIGAINESVMLESAAELLMLGGAIIKKLFMYIIILYVVVAAIDYMFQKKNYATEHKMTDKEVKDEYKQMEGDPYMKAKRRQVAQQIAFQQSQEHVPESDVVVINPTELAIAIKYDPEVSPVPFVLSKGEKRHADDIRSAARKAGVPVVRNKPLARALYELCEIGDLVPEDLYRPVAEVLAYVFALKDQNATGDAAQAAASASHADAPASPAAAHAALAASSAMPGSADDGIHDLQQVVVPAMSTPLAGHAASAAHNGQPRSALNAGWTPLAPQAEDPYAPPPLQWAPSPGAVQPAWQHGNQPAWQHDEAWVAPSPEQPDSWHFS